MKHVCIMTAALSLAALAAPCHAQSSDFDRAFAPQGAEARVSFIIPLGNSPSKTKTAPRLGFALRNYEQTASPSRNWMRTDAEPYREMRLGLTLEDAPKLMLNNQMLILEETEQANIGTAGKVGVGVVAVAVVVVAAGVIYLATGDCGLGESGGDDCGT